jgi:hypothetical protein
MKYNTSFPGGENLRPAALGLKLFQSGSNVMSLTLCALLAWLSTAPPKAHATLPPGNTVSQWNQIAENTVVGSGAFQAEGFIYMAYVSAAVYDAVVSIEGNHEPCAEHLPVAPGASKDAAVIEAAYRILVNYFPAQAPVLNEYYTEALALLDPGSATTAGQAVGLASANNIIARRAADGRLTPIGTATAFSMLTPGPGVYRRTPAAFAAPQTPWVGDVQPFILHGADQFLPEPPPSLESDEWVQAFAEIKELGASSSLTRTPEQTDIAKFWSANVIRQYNLLVRDITQQAGLGLDQTARLAAMVNVVGADALISCLHAKYHYLFWRPVTAIDPSAVVADGLGPVPGFDDGNPATPEETGWRPLLATPNHPEYPAAHGTITSAMAEVLGGFLRTKRIEIDLHGFDPAGPAGNLNAVRHYSRVNDLRKEIIEARLWAGLHYRPSSEAGVELGRDVAKYDLRHAFRERD